MDTSKRRSDAVANLSKAIKDQWADLLTDKSECIESIPDGWDSVRSFAKKYSKSEAHARKMLYGFVVEKIAERRLVRFAGEKDSFHIYRRLENERQSCKK